MEQTEKHGGGGSGAACNGPYSGAGSAGTSYSGGTGGGGAYYYSSPSGAGYGGTGGYGTIGGPYVQGSGGGAGNPGGYGVGTSASYGGNGTGGLLIVYGKNISNKGNILSNGSAGGNGYRSGGGGSGGGSINIFYSEICEGGTIRATGGSGGYGTRSGESANGGYGGNGSISIGNISTGTYRAIEDIQSTISSVQDLKNLKDTLNSGVTYEGKMILLTEDLDLTNESNGGKLISFVGTPFNGKFNQNSHSITYKGLEIELDKTGKNGSYYYKGKKVLPIYWYGYMPISENALSAWYETNNRPTITKNEKTFTYSAYVLTMSRQCVGGFTTSFGIDLGQYSSCHMLIKNSNVNTRMQYVSYTGSLGGNLSNENRNIIAYMGIVSGESVEYVGNLTNVSGGYYIGLQSWNASTSMEFEAWWLEYN